MNVLRVVYKDGQKYECAFSNDDSRFLEVNVNKVCTGEGSEDYLSIKCGCVRLLIAAMREVVRYELIPSTTINREKETWWETMKKWENNKNE